jgi:hypothetical protein
MLDMIDESRRNAVDSLLWLDRPITEIVEQLDYYPFDCEDGEEVTFTHIHAIDILSRYLNRELTETQVIEWAKIVEGRDDVKYEPGNEDLLKDLIFTLANQTISEKLSFNSAQRWIEKIEKSL